MDSLLHYIPWEQMVNAAAKATTGTLGLSRLNEVRFIREVLTHSLRGLRRAYQPLIFPKRYEPQSTRYQFIPHLRGSCRKTAGFSLIELLVVLAVISLLAGVVAPAGWRALANAERRGALSDLKAVIVSFPLLAVSQGKTLRIEETALAQQILSLPQDCHLTLPAPLIYAPNGMSAGGDVLFSCSEDARVLLKVAPITGEVSRADPISANSRIVPSVP